MVDLMDSFLTTQQAIKDLEQQIEEVSLASSFQADDLGLMLSV